MAYKCKNCGRFVAKNAIVCKYCGQSNPAVYIQEHYKSQKEENQSYLQLGIENEKKTTKQRWIDGKTMGYPNRTWRNVGIVVIAGLLFYAYAMKDVKQDSINIPDTTEQHMSSSEQEQDANKELVIVDGEAVVKKALPKSEYEIVYRWMETNQGTTSQECRLERIKKDGSFRVLIGGFYYSCFPKKITSSTNFIFHDVNSHNGELFSYANGTPIYYIPKMEDKGPIQTDGILIIQPDGSARVYMNDYNNQYFELFTTLRQI